MGQSNSSTTWRQAQKTLRKHWHVLVLLVLLVVLFLAGSWYGQRKTLDQKTVGGRHILHYVDPMNPAHTSPEPGLAPCGMKMEPVYADDEGQTGGSNLPPGSVKISPEKQQLLGVRLAAVEKSSWTYRLGTVGRVVPDDDLVYRLNAFIEGWIVKINKHTTAGSLVRKDEPLATFYNRDLPSTLQNFYFALDSLNVYTKDSNISQSQHDLLVSQKLTAEGVLLNLGMGQVQIDALSRSRELTQEITINAPATSIVLARNITTGQRFAAGAELFQLADLKRVWILADLYENEAKYIRPEEKVRVTMPDQVERRTATVSPVLSLFDPTTLTLKVRLEMDNPKFTLRPGMFVDVEFPIKMPPSINVPVDAIMDSGLKQTVFVDRGNGYFEPRRVKIGWRLGDRVEILEGLKPGERIAMSGNFLIDSESRMKLAAAGFFGNVVKDPVCGMDLDEGKANTTGRKAKYQGNTYYFCSAECQHHFEKNPARFAGKQADDEKPGVDAVKPKQATETAIDIVCNTEVNISQAKAEGLTSDYGGKTYYFSNYTSNHEFEKNPERYIKEAAVRHPSKIVAEMAIDPVCGMPVAAETAKKAGNVVEYQGKTYHFDTQGCKQRFDNAPQRYLSGSSGDSIATPAPVRTFPKAPLDSGTVLRDERQMVPGRPHKPPQAMPPGAQALPQRPTQAMPHGEAYTMPHGSPMMPMGPTQATPPATPQSLTPAIPLGGRQAVPHGAARPGPPSLPQVPKGANQTVPPVSQVKPQEPAQTKSQVVMPQEDSNQLRDFQRDLRRRLHRGPTDAMRRNALEGQRLREEYEKRQKEAKMKSQVATQVAPECSPLAVPQGSAPVKPKEQQPPQAKPPAQAPPAPHDWGHLQ